MLLDGISIAALTSILAKVGIEGVDSNLATAIRTCVVVVMAWVMVFITSAQGGISSISTQSFLSVSFFDRPEFSRSHPIMCFKNRIEMASVGKAKGF